MSIVKNITFIARNKHGQVVNVRLGFVTAQRGETIDALKERLVNWYESKEDRLSIKRL